MRPAVYWIGGAVVVAAGLAFALLGEDAGPSKSKGAKPAKRSARTRRPAKFRIAGEVLDGNGLPVKGATVYVLDKKRAGANRDKVPHEVTDGNGRWHLRVRKTVGCWIGVVAPGYRTTMLDGDTVDATKQMIHVVRRAPLLTVTLLDAAGKPIPKKGVQLDPWPPGGNYFCPGPTCRQGEQWGVTDSRGIATFRQDVEAPVLLTPYVEGFHSHPEAVWLADAAGAVTLTVHPNASLELTVTSTTPFRAVDRLITTEFCDPESGRPLFAFTESMQEAGRLRLKRAVRPGTYHLKVSMPGWPPALVKNVEVADKAPRVASVQVALGARTEARLGTLTVRLEGNKGKRRATKGRRRAPLSYVKRLDGNWPALGWTAGAPEAWDASRQRLEFRLEPGRYRLLVADVLTGRAAQESDIEVATNGSHTLTIAMKSGQFGAVPAVRKNDVYVRTLDARAPDGTRLPLYGSTRDGTQRFSRGIDLIARKLRGLDVVIGPYPTDDFSVTLLRSDGTRGRAEYR